MNLFMRENHSTVQCRGNYIRHVCVRYVMLFNKFLPSLASYSKAHPIQDLPREKLALLHNTSRPIVSRYLLYLAVLTVSLWLEATWLNVEVLLMWAHRTGTSYLTPFTDLIPISSDQLCKHLRTSLFVIGDADPGSECL